MSGVSFSTYQTGFKVSRRPKNPLDKCTIVSVYPREIIDYKPTAFPQTHRIEAATDNDFSITVVEQASWYKEMEEGQPFLEIPIPSTEVARAFIQDYVNGLPEYVPDFAAPGLFFVLGSYDKTSIRKTEGFDQKLKDARARQNAWYLRIVQLADKDWARTNGNPRSISDISRLAAEKLGLEKTWMQDFVASVLENCPACGNRINPAFPVCPNCKTVIDNKKFEALGLKFAS